jgi:hypothetical protein
MCRNQSAPLPATAWTRVKRLVLVLAAGISVCAGYGQELISELRPGGRIKLNQTDLEVLERGEPRHDLPCTVSQMKPELDWDFNFHTGYQVKIPLTALAGKGNQLTVLFRVIPQDRPGDLVYMTQKLRVPVIEEGSKGETMFAAPFALGEGKYHVDWLMRDQRERICSASWDLETRLNSKDVQLREGIPKTLVQPVEQLFAEEPPVLREPESHLPHVSIIVSFDPPEPSSAMLNDRDIVSLVAALRHIGRDPRVETSSIVACSLEAQQIIYQQDTTSRMHLQALGEALESLKLGMVDAKRLASSDGPGQFATDLIREHLKKEKPDALVVLGRKPGWGPGVSRQALESLGNSDIPVFYLSYSADLQLGMSPSRDLLSSIVKRLHGLEYQIYKPKDLFNTWSKVVSRIVRTKQAGQASLTGQGQHSMMYDQMHELGPR